MDFEPSVHVAPLLEVACMPPRRMGRAFWDALYELWRLSWFEIGTVPPPRCVTLCAWLEAIDAGAQLRAEDQCEDDAEDPRLSAEELALVAGGLLKAGMASLRFGSGSQNLLYAIDPHAAIHLQLFLNDRRVASTQADQSPPIVRDQRLRPGAPGAQDHAPALTAARLPAQRITLHYANLSARLGRTHQSWASRALEQAIQTANSASRKRPRTTQAP